MKKASAKPAAISERPVLVTTAHKGVFFGFATDTSGETIKLFRCRNCLYWGSSMRGFVGLAAHGPDESCKVGPAADIELRNITSVSEVTPDAVAKWEKFPWKN